MSVQDLKQSPMMAHLIEGLDAHKDIGHYGRLVFVMVGRFFMNGDELVKYLQKNPGVSEEDARAMVAEVERKGYNPPQRNTILEWQQQQEYPICPNADDPDRCNVYKELRFPDEVYQHVEEYAKQKVNS